MKPQRLRLEVFDCATDPDQPTMVLNREEIEDTRLEAFEQGYRAGWDDAAAARTEDDTRLRADIARAFAALQADQAAARRHVLAALRPLIEGMIGTVLPAAARAALPALIADAILPYAELAGDVPVDLVMHPDAVPEAEALLLETAGAPCVRITEDPALAPGQAFLRYGASETRIDIEAALARITRVSAEFFAQTRKDQDHG